MKKVFISGVSGDIGRALTEKYLQEGYFVVGQYNHDDSVCQQYKENCEFIKTDFSNMEEVKKLGEYLVKIHSDIEIIINNAGVDSYGLFSDSKIEEINRIMNINLTSAMYLTSIIGGMFLRKKKGNILNITSIWGRDGGSMEVLYSVTKGGLISFTKALSKEWGLSNIRVNALCLGYIDTKMNARFSEEDKQNFCENVSLGRIGTPTEVAKVAYFLTGEESSYITGQILGVDGGM